MKRFWLFWQFLTGRLSKIQASAPSPSSPPSVALPSLGLGAGLYIVGPTDEQIAGAHAWNATAQGYPLVRFVPQERVLWH